MLSKVEVLTAQGSLLSLPLADDSFGYRVTEVEGLDPVKATLVSSSFANLDGEQYHSSRREARNIKFKIELDSDVVVESVSTLRKKLYPFFMPKTQATYRFYLTDMAPVEIVGRVESFESPFFTDKPTVDISIICFDPDFYDPVLKQQLGMTTADTSPRSYTYDGTVDTGIKFVLMVNRSVSGFTIYHTTPTGEIRTLEFSGDLQADDWLLIDTIAGEKEAYIYRNGIQINMLYAISPESSWITLEPGLNKIQVHAEGPGIPLTVEHINKYGGL